MKLKLFITAIFTLLNVFSCFAQTKTSSFDCTTKKPVISSNQKIQEKVYRYSGYIKGSKDLPDSTKKKYVLEYTSLQERYNDVYKKMRGDIVKLKSQKKVCENYGSELNQLVLDSQAYIIKVQRVLNINNASFGVDDLLALLGFVIKKVEDNADKFYESVAWKNWEDLPVRSI